MGGDIRAPRLPGVFNVPGNQTDSATEHVPASPRNANLLQTGAALRPEGGVTMFCNGSVIDSPRQQNAAPSCNDCGQHYHLPACTRQRRGLQPIGWSGGGRCLELPCCLQLPSEAHCVPGARAAEAGKWVLRRSKGGGPSLEQRAGAILVQGGAALLGRQLRQLWGRASTRLARKRRGGEREVLGGGK